MRPGLYFDHAATALPRASSMANAISNYLTAEVGNPGRGSHVPAQRAQDLVWACRVACAGLIGVDDPRRIVMAAGCTDALNMAVKGVLQRRGGHVLCSMLEHNSVLRPLLALKAAGLIELDLIEPGIDGRISPERVSSMLRATTSLVAITHASNVFGTLQDLTALSRVVRGSDALFLVDAAQTIGLEEIRVLEQGIDLLAFPGHKYIQGPPGIGGLFVGHRVVPDINQADKHLSPWREGGGGDSAESHQPPMLPDFLESGTPNMLGIVALTAALQSTTTEARASCRDHLASLGTRLSQKLAMSPGVNMLVSGPERHVLSFVVDGVEPQLVASLLDSHFSISVRAGLHCAPEAHRWAGTWPSGTVRISLGHCHTEEDIDHLADAVGELASALRGSGGES
ncbi:MAG: aminotransferase class V-fold PLP-dependent enzyme [Rhodocyclaceae bacterium]|nr:aminotransferase class V-fold PLP-dependent enzyme [Rhodocyclaceae bacterium]